MVFKKILVAFDGSKLSLLAYKRACQIALKSQANIDIIYVIDNNTLKDISSYDTDYIHQIRDDINDKLDQLVKRAREQGIKKVNKFIELGNPKQIIVKDNFTQKHDLIVVGATGMSQVEKIFIGSVTEYIVNNTKSDCLIVKK